LFLVNGKNGVLKPFSGVLFGAPDYPPNEKCIYLVNGLLFISILHIGNKLLFFGIFSYFF